ncbi:hypothetical protein HD554DRAFT_2103679 [Boletus coccyginus]|nr:hypothetical protein HD554DRAFT_2103679 [Boletus coccyginus]
MFQEAISRPVACIAQFDVPPGPNPDDRGVHWAMRWDSDGQQKLYASSALYTPPTVMVAARSRRQAESVSIMMLVALESRKKEVAAKSNTSTYEYRLVCSIPSTPWQSGNEGGSDGEEGVGAIGDSVPRACTTICLGSSGRGVYVVGRELCLVIPEVDFIPSCDMVFGRRPTFMKGEALYLVDQHLQQDSNRLHSDGNGNAENGADEASWGGDKVDFDEGMGRFVVANERGGFDVVQLD